MEGPQSQEEAARADSLTGKLGPVMDLFWMLGGIVFIVLSSSILIGLTFVVYWLPDSLFCVIHLQVHYFISFLFCLGLTALLLVAVYWILPVRMDKMRDALVQGAGLVLLIYPFMIINTTDLHDEPVTALGIETPYWFLYSIFGLLLLVQPRMKRVNQLREDPHSVLTALGLCLGLLTMALTLFLMLARVIAGMCFAVLATSSLVVVVFTSMYAIHPRRAG